MWSEQVGWGRYFRWLGNDWPYGDIQTNTQGNVEERVTFLINNMHDLFTS